MNKKLFTLKGVNKEFTAHDNKISVLSNLDYSISRGDFIAIMGPSGTGKTTLLNILGGVDTISSGSLWFESKRLDTMTESEKSKWRSKNIAFIFQHYNLLSMLTAEQNIELPLIIRNISAKERKKRVDAALDLVNLTERKKHKPNMLSGGQQQRIAIARAIVSNVPVILCDEPTGNLDKKTSTEILDILTMLNTEFERTIVLVTHDQRAASYARSHLILDDGQISDNLVSDNVEYQYAV